MSASKLLHFIEQIQLLKPGESLEISNAELKECQLISSLHEFSTADWLLESIIGSAYEFSYKVNEQKQSTTFSRLKAPLDGNSGLRSYVSPDRLSFYKRRVDGLYEPVSS